MMKSTVPDELKTTPEVIGDLPHWWIEREMYAYRQGELERDKIWREWWERFSRILDRKEIAKYAVRRCPLPDPPEL